MIREYKGRWYATMLYGLMLLLIFEGCAKKAVVSDKGIEAPEERISFPAKTVDQAAVEKNAQWLKENPKIRISIEGHADARGTNEYNLALGERRAMAAKRYLEALGIYPERIKAISYGDEKPFCTGSNESCWQQNRRAHFLAAD